MNAKSTKDPSPMADSTGGSDVFPDEEHSHDRATLMGGALLTEGDRRERIAMIAYSKAQARGFEPGWDFEDWLEAERQVDDELAARASIERT